MSTSTEILRFLIQGDSKNIVNELRQVEAGFDGTESAGKRLAAQMVALADGIEADLKDARSAVDVLGAALGTEFVADIERAGGSVDQLVLTLKQAGLTYDDIRADADALGDALKRTADAGRVAGADIDAGATTAQGGLDRVRDSGDQSRSVLANMVGNSTQDLAGLGGVAGTVGMALGQIGEYATEGGISLKNLAAVAGPMAALAGVMLVVAQGAKQAAERTEEFEENIRKLSSATDDQVIAMYGQAMMRAALDGESFNDQLVEMAENNRIGLLRLQDLLVAQGASQKELAGIQAALDEVNRAQAQQEETERKYGEAVEGTTDALAGLEGASGRVSTALRDQLAALKDLLAEQLAAVTSANDLESAQIDLATAADDLATKQTETEEILKSSTATDAEKAQALRDLRQAQIDSGESALDAADKYAELNNKGGDLVNGVALQRDALERMKAQYPLLADEIQKYIDKLNSIPGVVETQAVFYTPTGDSKNRQGPRAVGGSTYANSIHEVNEPGSGPEIYEQDGKQFLITGTKPGRITPVSSSGSASAAVATVVVPVTVHGNVYGVADLQRVIREGIRQAADDAQFEARRGSRFG